MSSDYELWLTTMTPPFQPSKVSVTKTPSGRTRWSKLQVGLISETLEKSSQIYRLILSIACFCMQKIENEFSVFFNNVILFTRHIHDTKVVFKLN